MTDTVDLTVLGRRIERMDDQLHGIVNRLDRIEGFDRYLDLPRFRGEVRAWVQGI